MAVNRGGRHITAGVKLPTYFPKKVIKRMKMTCIKIKFQIKNAKFTVKSANFTMFVQKKFLVI